MKWSKLKKATEALLADSLKGRIKYHVTQYGPGESYIMARGWITLDGEEIENFSTVEWLIKRGDLAEELEQSGAAGVTSTTDRWADQRAAGEKAEKILRDKGVFPRDRFYGALEEYLQLSIDDALKSQDSMIQAVALLDRRCGARRLKKMQLPDGVIPFVRTCYRIRCEAEGIEPTI